jgi:hypothetical protein
MEPRLNDNDRETLKTGEKICPGAILPTIDPTWTGPDAKLGLPITWRSVLIDPERKDLCLLTDIDVTRCYVVN